MKNWIWISFDLGIKGDYQGMYRWLDAHDARECGDNLAGLSYEHSGDLLEALGADLREQVEISSKDRLYLVRLVEGKMKGKFIFGSRRAAPWEGYAGMGEQEEDSGG